MVPRAFVCFAAALRLFHFVASRFLNSRAAASDLAPAIRSCFFGKSSLPSAAAGGARVWLVFSVTTRGTNFWPPAADARWLRFLCCFAILAFVDFFVLDAADADADADADAEWELECDEPVT